MFGKLVEDFLSPVPREKERGRGREDEREGDRIPSGKAVQAKAGASATPLRCGRGNGFCVRKARWWRWRQRRLRCGVAKGLGYAFAKFHGGGGARSVFARTYLPKSVLLLLLHLQLLFMASSRRNRNRNQCHWTEVVVTIEDNCHDSWERMAMKGLG